MPHAYTEDQLVEQPAIGLFAELGWTTVSALEETFGAAGTLLRETKGEVVLVSRLRAALEWLNPALPPEAITAAVDDLTRDRSAKSLEAANREVYLLVAQPRRLAHGGLGGACARPPSLSGNASSARTNHLGCPISTTSFLPRVMPV